MEKQVYLFSEGSKELKDLLGNKGANLAEMYNLGLPVPFGFTIAANVSNSYKGNSNQLDSGLQDQIKQGINSLQHYTQKNFGSTINPLLLSVRSGASVSMPGMMDTVLNIGLNDSNAIIADNKQQNNRFLLDSYRRLIMMFGNIVKGVNRELFEDELTKIKAQNGFKNDSQLTADSLLKLVNVYKQIYLNQTGENFPQNVYDQLMQTVLAVFKSWGNPRAVLYRKLNNIDNNFGTAVNVQEMVFGNLNKKSGTGVAFSRNPINGKNIVLGEYLNEAQGEDVVAGLRTPDPLSVLKQSNESAYNTIFAMLKQLELHYKDMQEIEFTIENGKLYLLQTRSGKRTDLATVTIAKDLLSENVITEQEYNNRVSKELVQSLKVQTFSEHQNLQDAYLGSGLGACPGAVSGVIAMSKQKAVEYANQNINCILVRNETNPEDLEGMVASVGILTALGGLTSHASVVARSMNKCCVVGCSDLKINLLNNSVEFNGTVLKQGDYISLDGTTGKVYKGKLDVS